MRTFLVASSKGGAGKTTLATNLAAYYALDGKRTVLVDADRQHSATRWGEKRAGLPSAVLPVALVGNRLKPWTSASQQAMEQLKAWPYPLVAQLRDTQAYVLMVALGKSVFDYRSEQIRGHQEDWAPLLKWLKKA
jgi:cellulose biosynthesis protein BcsQ